MLEKNDINEDEKIEDSELDAEESNEDDTSQNDSASDEDDGDENTETNESEDPYEKKLKELEEENKKLKEEQDKKDEMLRQKSAALKEARQSQKSTTSNEEEKPLTKQQMLDILEERERRSKALEEIKSLTENPNEQKLIREFVEKGYSVDDAYLKANAHLIQKAKNMEFEENELGARESYLTKFSAGTSKGPKGSPKYMSNPILREAAKELDPEDRKFLNNL